MVQVDPRRTKQVADRRMGAVEDHSLRKFIRPIEERQRTLAGHNLDVDAERKQQRQPGRMHPALGILRITVRPGNPQEKEGDGLVFAEPHPQIPIRFAIPLVRSFQHQVLQMLPVMRRHPISLTPLHPLQKLAMQFGELHPAQGVLDAAKETQGLRRKKVGRVEVEITHFERLKFAAVDAVVFHQQLAQHDLQPADRADVAQGVGSVQAQFVAVDLGCRKAGRLLLFFDLVGRRTERTQRSFAARLGRTVAVELDGEARYLRRPRP